MRLPARGSPFHPITPIEHMPQELTDAQYREYTAYTGFGTPDVIRQAIARRDELETENGALRTRVTEQDQRLRSLPPEGALVLTGDDVAAYNAYKALGTPQEVQQKLAAGDTASADLARVRGEIALRDAAAAAGASLKVLRKLPGAETATYEVVEEGTGATKKQQVYVTPAGEGKQKVKFEDHVEAEWPEFKGVLFADAGSSGGGNAGVGGSTGGTPFPAQRGAGGRTNSDVVERHIESQYTLPSDKKE